MSLSAAATALLVLLAWLWVFFLGLLWLLASGPRRRPDCSREARVLQAISWLAEKSFPPKICQTSDRRVRDSFSWGRGKPLGGLRWSTWRGEEGWVMEREEGEEEGEEEGRLVEEGGGGKGN